MGDSYAGLTLGMWEDFLDGKAFSNGQLLALSGRVPLAGAKGFRLSAEGDLSGILGEYIREGNFKALNAGLALFGAYSGNVGPLRLSAGFGADADFLQAFDKYVDGTTIGIREFAVSPALRLTLDSEWISAGVTGSFGGGMSGNSIQGYDPLLRTKVALDLILHLGKLVDIYARNEAVYDSLKVGTDRETPDVDRSNVDYWLKAGGMFFPIPKLGMGLEGELNLHENFKNRAPLIGGKVKVEYRF